MSALENLPTALEWLRSVAGELTEAPTRLHEHAVQPADLLGSPRMSAGFFARLTDSPYATRTIVREVTCPGAHPRRRYGEALCPMCADTGSWPTTVDVYARPLAAALSSLARARSRFRPHPVHIVRALLREGCQPERAALALDPAPDERGFLSAVRALYDQYSYTAIPAMRAA